MDGVSGSVVHNSDSPGPLALDVDSGERGMGALGYLSRAALNSNAMPSSPESTGGRPFFRDDSVSPIRRITKRDPACDDDSGSSDRDANLVVIENPDGTLLEGMPSGFKHVTPIVSVPQSPRTMNFATAGIDLIDLFHRHEKVFAILLILTVLLDAILLSEEFTLVFSSMSSMQKSASGVDWSARIINFITNSRDGVIQSPASQASLASISEAQARHTFSIFPPHWQFVWAFAIVWLDLAVCLIFFSFGFVAYVSKQRKSYALFSTIACGALVWQVILSCADKLSLVLFLFRLAAFTHARFMGDLMDDIALLAALIGVRNPIVEANQEQDTESSERQSLINHT